MTSKTLVHAALVGASLICGATASAETTHTPSTKHHGSVQTHHCKQADGTMDMGKTKKQCLAEKGSWTKDDSGKSGASAPASVASGTRAGS